MRENNIQIEATIKEIERLEQQGKTVMLFAIEQEMTGLIAVADTVKRKFGSSRSRAAEAGY